MATSVVVVTMLVGQAAFAAASGGSPSVAPAGVSVAEEESSTTASTDPPSTPPTDPPSTPPTDPPSTPPTDPPSTPPTDPPSTPPTDPPSTPPTDPPTTPPPTCVGVPVTPEAPAGDIRRVLVADRSTNRYLPVGNKKGEATKDIQRRLLELGFWVASVDGTFGTTTSQAVMAFQKYLGLKRTGKVDQPTADALSCSRFRSFSNVNQNWTLVEIDKTRQLLFLVKNGTTAWTINTSTGSGKTYRERSKKNPKIWLTGSSITPNGWHKVYWQWPNGWKPGELGRIYRPKYVIGGVAIHGMTSVPGYPASHGCIRVSLPGMDMIWKLGWVTKGTSVWVHQ